MSWGCARARAGQPSRNRRETRDCAARPKLDGRMESRMRHVPNGPGWRSGRSGSWFGRRTRKKNCAGGGLYLEGQSRRRPAAASPLTLLRRGPACPPSLSLPLSPSWGCSATSTRLGRPAHPGHGADSTPSTGALRKEAPVPLPPRAPHSPSPSPPPPPLSAPLLSSPQRPTSPVVARSDAMMDDRRSALILCGGRGSVKGSWLPWGPAGRGSPPHFVSFFFSTSLPLPHHNASPSQKSASASPASASSSRSWASCSSSTRACWRWEM